MLQYSSITSFGFFGETFLVNTHMQVYLTNYIPIKHFKKKINKTYTQSRVSMHLHMHIQSQFFAVCLNSGWMEAFDTSDIAGQ